MIFKKFASLIKVIEVYKGSNFFKVYKSSPLYDNFDLFKVYPKSININGTIKEKSFLNIKLRSITPNSKARSLKYYVNFFNILLILLEEIIINKIIV